MPMSPKQQSKMKKPAMKPTKRPRGLFGGQPSFLNNLFTIIVTFILLMSAYSIIDNLT